VLISGFSTQDSNPMLLAISFTKGKNISSFSCPLAQLNLGHSASWCSENQVQIHQSGLVRTQVAIFCLSVPSTAHVAQLISGLLCISTWGLSSSTRVLSILLLQEFRALSAEIPAHFRGKEFHSLWWISLNQCRNVLQVLC
jgi:hypothetical protein